MNIKAKKENHGQARMENLEETKLSESSYSHMHCAECAACPLTRKNDKLFRKEDLPHPGVKSLEKCPFKSENNPNIVKGFCKKCSKRQRTVLFNRNRNRKVAPERDESEDFIKVSKSEINPL